MAPNLSDSQSIDSTQDNFNQYTSYTNHLKRTCFKILLETYHNI